MIVALPELSNTCVCSAPPSILYFTLPFDSPPLIVKTPVPFTQNGPFAKTLIVFPFGEIGLMVIVALADALVIEELQPEYVTILVNTIVLFDATFPKLIVALPELSNTCVCSAPPSILYFTLPFDSPPLTVKTPVPFTQKGPFAATLIVLPLVEEGLIEIVVVFLVLDTTDEHPIEVNTLVNTIV